MNENRLQKGAGKEKPIQIGWRIKYAYLTGQWKRKKLAYCKELEKGRETGENSDENRSGKMYAKKYNNRANEGKRGWENERA